MNVFTFDGNLGRDAEQRFTANGDSVVGLSVSCKSGYGQKAMTSWIKCSIFGNRGEKLLPHLKKGTHVIVSGEFSAREYADKDGAKRISNEVRVNDITLVSKKSDDAPVQRQAPSVADLDDDIPF